MKCFCLLVTNVTYLHASTENLIIYLNLSERFEERGLGWILSKVETALPYIDWRNSGLYRESHTEHSDRNHCNQIIDSFNTIDTYGSFLVKL